MQPNFDAKGDWIGLYLESADPTMTAPLKWTYLVPYLPPYEQTGKANATFQVGGATRRGRIATLH